MNRKIILLVLAGLCFVAGIVFGIVGILTTDDASSIEDLTALGEVTFTAYAATPEEDGTYTIYYKSEDGLHTYARYDVGKEEYDSYQFDVAVSMSENIEEPPQSKIKRYLYTYRKNGEFCEAIYDSYKTPYEVSTLIEDANRVSSIRYYVFAGVLVLFGGGLIFMALGRERKKEQ